MRTSRTDISLDHIVRGGVVRSVRACGFDRPPDPGAQLGQPDPRGKIPGHMNPVSRLVGRLTAGLRHAGGFSGSDETAALRRQTKDVQTRLSRLDALTARVQDLRKENQDLRRQIARLEKTAGSLATRDDVRELNASMKQLRALLPREVAAVRRDSRTERRAIERLQSQVLALIRRQDSDQQSLPYPYRLT